jgi:hypothetical protein
MKKLLLVLLMVSFLLPSEVGRYQISISTATTKKGNVYVVETVFDTKEGKVLQRKKIPLSKYQYPKKDKYGRTLPKK